MAGDNLLCFLFCCNYFNTFSSIIEAGLISLKIFKIYISISLSTWYCRSNMSQLLQLHLTTWVVTLQSWCLWPEDWAKLSLNGLSSQLWTLLKWMDFIKYEVQRVKWYQYKTLNSQPGQGITMCFCFLDSVGGKLLGWNCKVLIANN